MAATVGAFRRCPARRVGNHVVILAGRSDPSLTEGLTVVSSSSSSCERTILALSPAKKSNVAAGGPARGITVAAAAPSDDDFDLDFTKPGALDGITVTESAVQDEATGARIHPLIEQIAMLHSGGQDREAAAILAEAIGSEDLGDEAERAWAMLFELLQLIGERGRFEALALDYAARFEKSPPAWVGDNGSEAVTVAGGRSQVALSGTLSARVEGPLKQLLQLAEKYQQVRIELSRIQDADSTGCALLFDALGKLRRMKRECTLGGADKLAQVLVKRIEVGKAADEPVWQLLLELYQHAGNQESFEEMAINYAITFEVSPPSWVPLATPAKTKVTAAEPAPPVVDGCALEGVILDARPETFDGLTQWAADKDEVPVDVSRLQRMDFVSAGQLLNVIDRLHGSGKRVVFKGTSPLLAALWDVIGIGRKARIELRKR